MDGGSSKEEREERRVSGEQTETKKSQEDFLS